MTRRVASTAVRAQLDRLAPRYLEALQTLVQIPSTIGEETAAQNHVAELMRAAGFESDVWQVDRMEFADDPRSGCADGGERPRPNVTAIRAGRGGGRSLALSGHVDVVPPGPLSQWTRDPWGGQIENGRLYGRGALDMKGGLIAAIHAAHAVVAAGIPLRGDLVLESVIEEEATGNGTLAARRRGPRVDGAIIPEVTREEIQTANPGVVWFELTTTGRSAYVGQAGASANAIDLATGLVHALRDLPREFNTRFAHPAYEGVADPLTLNVGTMVGGDWPSSVPLECRVGLRLSFPIGWSVDQARAAVEECVRAASDTDPWLRDHPPAIRWHGFQATGWSIDRDQPIVRELAAAVGAATGTPARYGAMLGTADARFFGDAGIPVVYFGPAGEGQHGPNEYVDLASVERVAAVLADVIVRWCS